MSRKKRYRKLRFPYSIAYTKTSLTPEQRDQLVNMRDVQQMTWQAIARHFGVKHYQTIQRIYNMAKDLGAQSQSMIDRTLKEVGINETTIPIGSGEHRREGIEKEGAIEEREEPLSLTTFDAKDDVETQKDKKYVADLKQDLETVVIETVKLLKERLKEEGKTLKLRDLVLMASTLIDKAEKMLNLDRLKSPLGGTGFERFTTQELRLKVTQNERKMDEENREPVEVGEIIDEEGAKK